MNIHTTQDPHSFYVPGQPKTTSLSWDFGVDFTTKRLRGVAVHTFDKPGPTTIDTWHLEIINVSDVEGGMIGYALGEHHPIKGTPLTFVVPESCEVALEYSTSEREKDAKGMQWMAADLCGGHPFVYTQGEAINARSYIPCQDTPSIKFTFKAIATVPAELCALIAASTHESRIENNGYATETWDMPYPITSYLIAFAIGDLVSKDVSDRSCVWALPSMVEAAAAEFRDIPKLMEAGESIFGQYPFGRYDVLVMPPAFPYGGMENPCLTFVTPALVVGDGSGLTTIAHELAHSWTGNLVTNANWDAFWLNEGFTVYAEYRIGKMLFGQEAALVHLKLLEREFRLDCERFLTLGHGFLTKLAPGADEMDPDEIFSRVPYFKGALFLICIEEHVGLEAFDAFLRQYLVAFAFTSIDTERFIAFATDVFGTDVMREVGIQEWIYGEGLPDNAPLITSSSIAEMEQYSLASAVPPYDVRWDTPLQQLYLELLPRPVSMQTVATLDTMFGFSDTRAIEVRWSFLVMAIEAGYDDVLHKVAAFLQSYGRMKYLNPLYGALCGSMIGRKFAEQVFEAAKVNYHPTAIANVQNRFATTKITR